MHRGRSNKQQQQHSLPTPCLTHIYIPFGCKTKFAINLSWSSEFPLPPPPSSSLLIQRFASPAVFLHSALFCLLIRCQSRIYLHAHPYVIEFKQTKIHPCSDARIQL